MPSLFNKMVLPVSQKRRRWSGLALKESVQFTKGYFLNEHAYLNAKNAKIAIDLDNCRRLGVDEQYIRFRPSPNFKNMKKFLKSKIDNSESSSQSPPNGSLEQTTPNNNLESPPRSVQQRLSPIKQIVQPPLPLEPPPPDSPPIIPVPVKEEIIDDEYQENGHESPNLSTSQADTSPRTGILPPQALNHLKKPFYMLPPPPPPPPEEAPVDINQNASPVSPHRPADKPIISCVPTLKLESKPAENDFRNMLQAISSPLKREWSASSFNPPRDLDNKENFAKKCKNCDTMEFRLEFNKSKIESMTRSSEELRNKAALLHKKSNTLFSVLFTVLKTQASKNGLNGLSATLNMCGEKEKQTTRLAILQHILETNRSSSNNMISTRIQRGLNSVHLFQLAKKRDKDIRPEYHPVGLVYADTNTFMCNCLLIRYRWSLAPGHCVAARSDPDLADVLPRWRIKYRTRSDSIAANFSETAIKRSIAHPHFNNDDFSNNIVPNQFQLSASSLKTFKDDLELIGWEESWQPPDGHILETSVRPVTLEKCTRYVSPIVDLRNYEYCVKPAVRRNATIVCMAGVKS
ncbi:hypothetical protein MSG28_001130 [Choristoneura fumiferana]|uniref:Uncharacterized protein n=1 Tax=Choristoneura fumiferana TaxID=7141 RepID=A0ACC0K480_CHOFU|nr:hypothetical protein MSG28_001130 [Choristoneura fumiferana]